MAKEVYEYKQVQIPVDAYKKVKDAYLILKAFNPSIRMADVWMFGANEALIDAVKLSNKEFNSGE